MMYKKHCFTQGLTKVIILLVICDISFCYNFVMKMFVIWPCFLVHTFKTSRLKSLTTSSRVPHYLVQVPRKCIQCYQSNLRTIESGSSSAVFCYDYLRQAQAAANLPNTGCRTNGYFNHLLYMHVYRRKEILSVSL